MKSSLALGRSTVPVSAQREKKSMQEYGDEAKERGAEASKERTKE